MYDRYKSTCIRRNFNCIFDIIVLLYSDLSSEKSSLSYRPLLLGLSDEIYAGLFAHLMNFRALPSKKLFNVDKCISTGHIENPSNL